MKTSIISLFALILALSPLQPALAANIFNPDFIISDAEFLDAYSLDKDGIQHFLERGS